MSDNQMIQLGDRFFTLVGDSYKPRIQTMDETVIVPLTDTGMVIFLVAAGLNADQQERLMLPCGVIQPEEAPEMAANRQLEHDLGYHAGRLDHLGELYPWMRYLEMRQQVFLAQHLTPGASDEQLLHQVKTQLVALRDFERLIAGGQVADAGMIAALFLAYRRMGASAP